jgi:predicted outer membrane repeat protein
VENNSFCSNNGSGDGGGISSDGINTMMVVTMVVDDGS